MTSLGSTVAASDIEGPPKPDDLDALEAEIETIKADIQILREGAESMHQTHVLHTNDHQSDLPLRVEGSKIPAPVSRRSAAKAGAPKRGEVKVTCIKTSASSTNIHNPHLTSTPHSTPPSPHFAQPTQAATRRVHQTLCKDASPVKSSPELTPGRSTKAKAPDFATDKRAAQRHQKRTSLPQSWAMSTPPTVESDACKSRRGDHPIDPDSAAQSQHAVMALGTAGSGTPFTNAQPTEQAPNATTSQKNSTPTKSSSAEQSPSNAMLRKNTSSYMSPTASARRRIADNLAGRDARLLKFNEARSNRALAESAEPSSLAVYNTAIDVASTQTSDVTYLITTMTEPRSPREPAFIGGRPVESNVSERLTHTMRLPMPLPQVANTVVTSQELDHNLLDPIKEKLGKEDLLRRDPAHGQSAASHHDSHNDISKSVFAQMNRPVPGTRASSTIQQAIVVGAATAQAAEEPSYHDHSVGGASNNGPISQRVTGLRGQSSANIGKALGSTATSDPAVLYQGPKPSSIVEGTPPSDPAIMFQCRKLSGDHGQNRGPVLVLKRTELPQAGSLRPTAMTFVPVTETPQVNTSWPRGPNLFNEQHPVSNQAGGVGYLQDYQDYEPSYLRYDPDMISGETPAISPVSNLSSSDTLVSQGSEAFPYFHQNAVEAPIIVPWTSAPFGGAPPPMDPSHQEFQGNFIGGGTDMVAPYTRFPEMVQYPDPATMQFYGPAPAPSLMQHPTALQLYGPPPGPPTHLSMPPTYSSMPSAPTPAWSAPGNVQNEPQWQIQGAGRRPYEWHGGDGREISFRGIGPDAEHDPNRAVEYRDLRANTRTVHTNAASSSHAQRATSTTPPTAPRSMREHAKRMSDSQLPRPPHDQQEGK